MGELEKPEVRRIAEEQDFDHCEEERFNRHLLYR
ncbi:hypothetical protein O9992_15880 [Vibrio lentus]|nr:hypothetical protein [Vibrio lentus]